MNKYTNAVLAVIALCMLALPVKAEEKVWYCEMTEFVGLSRDGLERYLPEKFKMKVTTDSITFGSGGYLGGNSATIQRYLSEKVWSASDGLEKISFVEPDMTYVFQGPAIIHAFIASCDDF